MSPSMSLIFLDWPLLERQSVAFEQYFDEIYKKNGKTALKAVRNDFDSYVFFEIFY